MTKPQATAGKEPLDAAAYIGEIDDILGFHIRLAHGATYRHFMKSFKSLKTTQKQVSVLWLIADHPGIAQAELAQRLQLDRATVMGIVNRLAKRHYIARGPSPTDGRKQTLKLLPTGSKALQDAKRAVRAHDHWLRSRFNARETKTLIQLLRRIHGLGADPAE